MSIVKPESHLRLARLEKMPSRTKTLSQFLPRRLRRVLVLVVVASAARKVTTGLRGVLTRPRRFTSLEELIAPRAEKFMAGFHLALSYRWDGAIIARMCCYLECRKVADGLSPLTRREAEERCLRYFPICLLARFESRNVRLTQLTHLDV